MSPEHGVFKITQASQSSFASKLPILVVLTCALATALLHHFAFAHPRTTFLYDARSYLSSTAHIAEWMQSILHGHPNTEPIANHDFLAAIVNDGPVLTGTFAALFTLLGHVPLNKDWTTIEMIQSVMHALSAALIYIAARRATKIEVAAIFAGLVWATYPAAVIASGRYYNEPLMILLMLASLVCVSKRPATAASTTAGSFFSGLVFLMKPALVAGAGLSYLCAFLGSKSKLIAIPLIAAGIVLAFGPWALYTKAFIGKAYFTTPRNSAYNFAMGNDTEVDGVLTSPMPPLTDIFVNAPDPVYFMYAQWCDNTRAYLTMVLRKATRMYANPWNDFRHTFFGLKADAQQVWHLFLLFSGMTGLFLFVWETLVKNKIDYDQNSVWILSLGWLASPLIYLLFEANSRYGFTITPFLAVFTALPVARLSTHLKERQQQKELDTDTTSAAPPRKLSPWPLYTSTFIAAVFTLLIANLDDITHLGQSKELSFELSPHEVASKILTLTPAHKPPDLDNKDRAGKSTRLFIMVDGDERLSQAKVTLNGHDINGALKHLRYFYPSKYSEYYVFQELGYSMAELPQNYRQWRIVEIPADYVNWSGDNTIKVRAPDSGMLVYGESNPTTRHYLSPLYYSPIKIGNASTGLETRLVMPETKARIEQLSMRDDGAGHQKRLSGSLRVHLVVADLDQDILKKEKSPAPSEISLWPSEAKHFAITSKNFDPCFSTGDPSELHTSRHVVDEATSVCSVFTLGRAPGSNATKLKLTGMIKANKPGSKVGLLLASTNKGGLPVLVSNTPPYLTAGPEWQPFVIEDILPDGELKDGPICLTVAIYPGPWEEICGYSCDKHSADAVLKNLKLDMEPTYQLDLTKYRLLLL